MNRLILAIDFLYLMLGGNIVIEIPEAIVISNQIRDALTNKIIKRVLWLKHQHKFAFMHLSKEDCEKVLPGKKIGLCRYEGSKIILSIDPGYLLILGEGGQRILFHENEKTVPEKHHALIEFEDKSFLTVTIQGWGSVMVLPKELYVAEQRISPISDKFTKEYFINLCEQHRNSVKGFLISKPGIPGIGNGCLQDILFNAGIHPRTRVSNLSHAKRCQLYTAILGTVKSMISENGRNTEYDLYNSSGRYKRIMHGKAVGTPCIKCGQSIEKSNFMGGVVYFCPGCQVL